MYKHNNLPFYRGLCVVDYLTNRFESGIHLHSHRKADQPISQNVEPAPLSRLQGPLTNSITVSSVPARKTVKTPLRSPCPQLSSKQMTSELDNVLVEVRG